jgi:hypothetical protein
MHFFPPSLFPIGLLAELLIPVGPLFYVAPICFSKLPKDSFSAPTRRNGEKFLSGPHILYVLPIHRNQLEGS